MSSGGCVLDKKELSVYELTWYQLLVEGSCVLWLGLAMLLGYVTPTIVFRLGRTAGFVMQLCME